MMFYPKCTCGGKVESAASDHIERSAGGARRWLLKESLTGHSHPYLRAATLGVTLGREIYKRVPGGGEKRCTSCGRTFR